ncbi:MAG TPA: CPBP family intramembrane glutamic endopeptidase, partial [Pirellulaceae bacterium]|nr:CPBP family intramembrane glutamic endopeptidase [Pirellulaceae bacterium]
PPVYLIQVVLVQLFPKFHPLIEQLRKTPDATLLIATGLTVTLVAPLCEEYLFRGLLQGWLESLRGSLTSDESILGPRPPAETITFDGKSAPPTVLTTVPKWPILVSALLFAGAHYSHGPAPIALFFLAIGLGYLYQRTHRLLPCIMVHFLLNGWTTVVLLIEIYSPLPK